jgi:ATP-binding cassette, subfamily A (ABC1), member 3
MEFQNLTKEFDEKVVVNKLSMSLFEGEIYCLLGHNGAGKSTTINMLTGILKPDAGTIRILDFDYYTQMHLIRSKTGVCLQTDVLYDDLTVREHLEFYANLKGTPSGQMETMVEQMITRCGLTGEQFKKTKELSGGNKRKTCLACAAIGDSRLLFLDEPSSGLDPGSRRIIWGLIDSLRKEGRTIILTTHHLEEAEFLANRIGFLAHGEMLV